MADCEVIGNIYENSELLGSRSSGQPGTARKRQYRAMILLAYTGLRWGECSGLKVKRVDLLRRRLTVARDLRSWPPRGWPRATLSRHMGGHRSGVIGVLHAISVDFSAWSRCGRVTLLRPTAPIRPLSRAAVIAARWS